MKRPILNREKTFFGMLRFMVLLSLISFGSPSTFAFSPQLKASQPSGGAGDDDQHEGLDSGGSIADSETVCSGIAPIRIENTASPNGGFGGLLIIKWQRQLAGEGIWIDIPGATSLEYTPPVLAATTHFRRAAKRSFEESWKYSNIVTKTVVSGITDVKVATTDVTCKGGDNGTAVITPQGGTPNYTYQWSNGGNQRNLSGLAAGSYSVTITDRNGCQMETDVTVEEPVNGIEAETILTIDASCPEGTDGGIFIDAFNGTPPYSFAWSNGNNQQENLGIGAGVYDVTVTDSKGCVTELSGISIEAPAAFAVKELTTDVSCNGFTDGQTQVKVAGGTPPYDYQWSNGSVTTKAVNLPAGEHTLDIIDRNGCLHTRKVLIEEPAALEVEPYVINNQICKGYINAVTLGGTAPYTYEWSNGATSNVINNVCPGEYSVKITDANGCKQTQTLSLDAQYVKESLSVEVLSNPGGLGGNVLLKITLPFTDHLNVTTYSVSGQIIEQVYSSMPESGQTQLLLPLNLNKYANGTYLVHVLSGNDAVTEKIMIAY